MDEYLHSIYYNASDAASFGGAYKLYEKARLKYPEITFDYVKSWLIDQTAYTLHKKARRIFKRNKYYVSFIDELWQSDLIDMSMFSRQNSGFKYIVTIIDCFSKYLFAVAVKTKKSMEIMNVFKTIFETRKPLKLMSDRGGEYDNNQFKAFTNNNNVKFYTTKDKLIKCAIIERANRTLKEKIFRYFTYKGTRKYIDVLESLVDSYNKTKHRTIKVAPIEVTENNEKHVFRDIYGVSNLKQLFFGNKTEKSTVNISDKVRIKYDLSKLDKSYYPLWTDQVYTVNKIIGKPIKPQYIISRDGNLLDRRFYSEELQKLSNNPVYRIEKIISSKTINGEKYLRVKWLNYPSRFNQWIHEKEIVNLK